MKIILPKMLVNIEPKDGPLFFLAGPVRGGGDWQHTCCTELRKIIPNFYAALPCRYEREHPLYKYRAAGTEDYFDRQLTWERYYLNLAAMTGCILFWIPCESAGERRTGDEPYAMDTRGELGEWRGRLMSSPLLRIIIGAESGFPGLSQIKRNFSLALERDFPIYPTLAATATMAVRRALRMD